MPKHPSCFIINSIPVHSSTTGEHWNWDPEEDTVELLNNNNNKTGNAKRPEPYSDRPGGNKGTGIYNLVRSPPAPGAAAAASSAPSSASSSPTDAYRASGNKPGTQCIYSLFLQIYMCLCIYTPLSIHIVHRDSGLKELSDEDLFAVSQSIVTFAVVCLIQETRTTTPTGTGYGGPAIFQAGEASHCS